MCYKTEICPSRGRFISYRVLFINMAEEISKEEKKKFKEGKATAVADGLADTATEVTKIAREVLNAPLRTTGRVIDGAVQGAKERGPVGVVTGSAEGLTEGVKTSLHKIGKGFEGVGKAYKKIASGLTDKEIEEKERKELEE